jgi:hypothetical protein
VNLIHRDGETTQIAPVRQLLHAACPESGRTSSHSSPRLAFLLPVPLKSPMYCGRINGLLATLLALLGDDVEVRVGEPVGLDTPEEPPERRGIRHV